MERKVRQAKIIAEIKIIAQLDLEGLGVYKIKL